MHKINTRKNANASVAIMDDSSFRNSDTDGTTIATMVAGDGVVVTTPMITARSDQVRNVLHQSTDDENYHNETSSIQFHIGSDSTSANTIRLILDIVSLPQHGILIFNNNDSNDYTNTTLISLNPRNHRFPIDIAQSLVSLTYQLTDRSYFNTPTKNAFGVKIRPFDDPNIESFEFRIRAYFYFNNTYSSSSGTIDSNETTNPMPRTQSHFKLIAISPIMTQMIHVVHVHYPGTLIMPNPVHVAVTRIPLRSATFSDSVTMATKIEAMILSPIRYVDTADYDIYHVRVDIWVEYGTGLLSLHEDGLPLAHFCQNDNYAGWINDTMHTDHTKLWNCHGNGTHNPNMTFVAIPSDIEVILRYLRYETIVVHDNGIHGQLPEDTIDRRIHIHISDGIGGTMCLNEWEHNRLFLANADLFWDPSPFTNITTLLGSREKKCYQTMVVIPIPSYNNSAISHLWNATDPDMYLQSPKEGFFDFLNIADVLFWGFVCMVIAGCTSSYRKLLRCVARGKGIDVENWDDDHNNGNNDHHQIDMPTRDDNDDHFSTSSVVVDDGIETPERYRNNMVL